MNNITSRVMLSVCQSLMETSLELLWLLKEHSMGSPIRRVCARHDWWSHKRLWLAKYLYIQYSITHTYNSLLHLTSFIPKHILQYQQTRLVLLPRDFFPSYFLHIKHITPLQFCISKRLHPLPSLSPLILIQFLVEKLSELVSEVFHVLLVDGLVNTEEFTVITMNTTQ